MDTFKNILNRYTFRIVHMILKKNIFEKKFEKKNWKKKL